MTIVVADPVINMADNRRSDLWRQLRRAGGLGTQLLQSSTGLPIPPPEIIWSTAKTLVSAMRRDAGRRVP